MPNSSVYRTAAAAAVAVGALVFSGTVAGAQTCYPPTAGCVTTSNPSPIGPTLSLSATTVARGQRIVASIAGFQPGTTGIIVIDSTQIGTFAVPASGVATVTITIPTNISLGAHTISARGTAFGGQPGSASQGITVVAGTNGGTGGTGGGGGSGGNLARTGVAVGATTAVGVGLVAGGMAMKRSGRRRRANSPA